LGVGGFVQDADQLAGCAVQTVFLAHVQLEEPLRGLRRGRVVVLGQEQLRNVAVGGGDPFPHVHQVPTAQRGGEDVGGEQGAAFGVEVGVGAGGGVGVAVREVPRQGLGGLRGVHGGQ